MHLCVRCALRAPIPPRSRTGRCALRARELARDPRFVDEPQQLRRVDGLGQVVVEAGGERLAAVGVLAPAGDRDQRGRRGRPRARGSRAATSLPLRCGMPMSSRQTCGRTRVVGEQRVGAVVGQRDLVAFELAAARPGSRRRRGCRRRPGCGAPARRAARRRRRGAAARSGASPRGRRTVNTLPWPAPVAVHADRAAVQLDQALASAPGRCRGRSARSPVPRSCVNMSNTAGSDSGAMPMPLSLTSITTSSPSSAASSRMRPCGSVYLAALVSRLATTCDDAQRIGLHQDRRLRHDDLELVVARVDQRARGLDGRLDHLAQRVGAAAQREACRA